jgi:P-type Cu2+ transporter
MDALNACKHCGLPAPDGPFCCPGCAAVYSFIHQAGLGDYYRFRPEASGRAVEEDEANSAMYRDPEVAASFLFEGRYYCLLDGLHCAACAWLIERAVESLAEDVSVNYSTQRLSFAGTPQALAHVVDRVRQLGYRAIPYDPNRQERPRARADRMLLLRLGVAACAAGNVMLAALALYSGADEDAAFRPIFHALSLGLTIPVVTFSAWPFYMGARNALRHGQLTTDVSITLGLSIVFLYSLVATAFGSQHVYFDTAAMFIFVLLSGRLLESAARSKAGSSIERLLTLSARTASRWNGTHYEEVPADRLTLGDRVEVKPGCRVPADGVILSGQSFVDESHLTGESQPRSAEPGKPVYGGSLAVDGRLEISLTQTGGSSLLAQVARLVESAQCTPAPIQKVADCVARYLLPLILMLSIGTFLWGGSQGWPWSAVLDRALAVLIITCPCALGIATPLVVSVATGVAARRGVLFRDGLALETARQVTDVVLDKTGTLTLGELRMCKWEGDLKWLQWATSLETRCNHPLARAFRQAYPGALLEVADVQQVPGQGVVGNIEGVCVRLGRAGFLGRPELDGLAEGTSVWLEAAGEVVARFSFQDSLRPEAASFLQQLRQRGVRLWLASGDRRAVVGDVAAQLGIDNVRAECMPVDKVQLVEEIQSGGGVVGFIGDGINDAPALRKANLGITVANGSELSWETADVVLLRPGLQPANLALDIARAAWLHLLINLGLAFLYNAVAIPAAMLGYVTPLWAAVAMPLSSLLVVGQSLAMLSYQDPPTCEEPSDGRTLFSDPGSTGALRPGTADVRVGSQPRPV